MVTMLRYFGLLIMIFGNSITYAMLGDCNDFSFPVKDNDTNAIDTSIPVRVLHQETPLYPSIDAKTPTKSLDFDLVLKPIRLSPQRIQVADRNTPTTPMGWIEKTDLLCNYTPLIKSGLPRKAFIKIPVDAGENFAVLAYPSPQDNVCKRPCNELTSFTTYFIFAEDEKRLLFSSVYNLSLTTSVPLTGWVDKDKAILWNTNFGLRPREDAKEISGYYSPEDYLKQGNLKNKGVELVGGNIWYKHVMHLPLLDTTTDFYKITAPGVGMRGFNPLDLDALDKFKQADIFFLLDGTASMQPYIKAAGEAAKQIAETLRTGKFRETTFRCGFLVYRDAYAEKLPNCDKQGICEGLVLSSSSCESNTEQTSSCGKQFQESINLVKASSNDGDDYPENLFAGLRASISKMNSCKDNNKLLFVIGDHGDRDNRLPQTTIDAFKKQFPKRAIFFIQTKNDVALAKDHSNYASAYRQFSEQAKDIINKIIPSMTSGLSTPPVPIPREDYFLSLDDGKLAEKIAEKIAQQLVTGYADSGIINDLKEALLNGESFKSFYEKHKKDEMPILYWEWLEQTVCTTVKEQCNKPANHRVMEFYVPVDDTLFEREVVLIQNHIEKWRELLRPLTTLSGSTTDQKMNFKNAILVGIAKVLGQPPISEEDSLLPLKEILTHYKESLPVRPDSPLFQYTLKDIEEMQDCEFLRLMDRTKSAYQILGNVLTDPTSKVSFQLKSYEDYERENGGTPSCPGITEKGKKLKKVIFGAHSKLGSDDTYRYGHGLKSGITLYWLPLEFLP